MALNPNTIKALFGKLAPLADDAAGAVAKYGDDALAVVDRVDDFLPPATVTNPKALAGLKERLIDKRLPYDHFTYIKPPASASKASAEFVEGFNDPMSWGRFPRYTKTLGAVDADLFASGDAIVPKGSAVSVPEMPTSGLVVNRGQRDDWRVRGFELRPHKNTALGRWYSKHVVPVDSTRSILDYPDGIGSFKSAENPPEWDWRSDMNEWIPF